jgi:biopolymer transport protein TolR
MTANVGDSSTMSSQINLTPMIDVLLVLLIIFMVIAPVLPRGESAHVPQPARNDSSRNDSVVLELLKGTSGKTAFRINRHEISRSDLPGRLAEIYAKRVERVLFVKGDDELTFAEVADAIDVAHAAGVDRVGLVTPKLAVGQ